MWDSCNSAFSVVVHFSKERAVKLCIKSSKKKKKVPKVLALESHFFLLNFLRVGVILFKKFCCFQKKKMMLNEYHGVGDTEAFVGCSLTYLRNPREIITTFLSLHVNALRKRFSMQRMWTSYILESIPMWKMDCKRDAYFRRLLTSSRLKKNKLQHIKLLGIFTRV